MAARSGGGSGPGAVAGKGGASPSGPGARRPERSAPSTRRTTRVEAEPDAAPRRKNSVTSRALVLLLVMAVLGVSYASSIRAWLNQRSEQHTLSAQIAAKQAAIADLTRQKARWNDPAYVEAQARLRFGWVMPGERSYRVIGPDGKVLAAGNDQLITTPSGQGSADRPWWSGGAGSLARADAVPQPAESEQPTRTPATRIGPPPPGGQ